MAFSTQAKCRNSLISFLSIRELIFLCQYKFWSVNLSLSVNKHDTFSLYIVPTRFECWWGYLILRENSLPVTFSDNCDQKWYLNTLFPFYVHRNIRNYFYTKFAPSNIVRLIFIPIILLQNISISLIKGIYYTIYLYLLSEATQLFLYLHSSLYNFLLNCMKKKKEKHTSSHSWTHTHPSYFFYVYVSREILHCLFFRF